MPIDFLTLLDELQELANQLLNDLNRRGFRTSPEPNLLMLPATSTIMATRGHETHHFLVRQNLTMEEADEWHRFCCSCSTDTRLTICFPPGLEIAANHLATLRTKGVGVAFVASDLIQHDSEARDLAFHARAPDRSRMKPKVRELLGESLDRFDRGDWRPAFEEACAVFEEACRAYLIKNCKMGRAKYQNGGKVQSPTVQQIKKMPMGALKDIFCRLISQNKLEANLCSALTQLNPDRIRRAHKRTLKRSETALRKRVGSHFWLINNALSLLV
jgi:hypothetical protein